MKIVFYGAGGPVAASGIAQLGHHDLVLTDLAPAEEWKSPPAPGHPIQRVDVTDPDSVLAAAEGADVLINCTVVRPDEQLAFHVNTRGAYNVMQAAVRCGIPRVIHTGPAQMFGSRGGYMRDWHVVEQVPPRPGLGLYAITKFLGHEIVRTFCAHHPELCCIAFYYSGFYDPGQYAATNWPPPFAVHCEDAGQAFRLGAEIERDKLPSNFELFHISADLPSQRISIEKARRILGYAPRHNFEHCWRR